MVYTQIPGTKPLLRVQSYVILEFRVYSVSGLGFRVWGSASQVQAFIPVGKVKGLGPKARPG